MGGVIHLPNSCHRVLLFSGKFQQNRRTGKQIVLAGLFLPSQGPFYFDCQCRYHSHSADLGTLKCWTNQLSLSRNAVCHVGLGKTFGRFWGFWCQGEPSLPPFSGQFALYTLFNSHKVATHDVGLTWRNILWQMKTIRYIINVCLCAAAWGINTFCAGRIFLYPHQVIFEGFGGFECPSVGIINQARTPKSIKSKYWIQLPRKHSELQTATSDVYVWWWATISISNNWCHVILPV